MKCALAVKTVMILVFVARCGAVPTTAPSKEELSKAQVNSLNIALVCWHHLSWERRVMSFLRDSVRPMSLLFEFCNNKLKMCFSFFRINNCF